MRRAWVLVPALLLLAACGGGGKAAPTQSPTAPGPSASQAIKGPTPGGPAVAPTPDAGQQADLLAKLKAIDPSLGGDEDVALASQTCADILGRVPALDQVVTNAMDRFKSPAGPLSEDKAQQVVDLITNSAWCK